MEWNRKFPIPNRADHTPQQDAKREFYPELDLSKADVIMSDGRPAVIENWYDRDMELFCRTVFYSMVDIESWSELEHYTYIATNGLLKGKLTLDEGAGLQQIVDPSGNEIWSVTIVMA